MSKVAIKGALTGTGTFTIESPATNTDRVLVLPDVAGTVLTSASDLAGVTGAGKVMQVVHFDYNTIQAFTTPSPATQSFATGLTATITPSSTNSKILVLCSANIGHNNSDTVVRVFLERTGPSIANNLLSANTSMGPFSHVIYIPTPQWMSANSVLTWLDSPNSTAACTFTLRIGGNTPGALIHLNTHTGYVGQWGSVSHLTLLEIAA